MCRVLLCGISPPVQQQCTHINTAAGSSIVQRSAVLKVQHNMKGNLKSGENISSIAPSSEELRVQKEFDQNA